MLNINASGEDTGGGGNFGIVEALSGGTVSFTGGLFSAAAAEIESSGTGSQVEFRGGTLRQWRPARRQ